MTARDVMRKSLRANIWLTADEKTDAILAALAGAGFAVVPVEPDMKMYDAGYKASDFGRSGLGHVYRAMVAAAQPAREGGE